MTGHWAVASAPETQHANQHAIIRTPGGAVIAAEIADTPDKRAQGLMFRTSLAPDQGMLFTFPDLGHWTFWMKNTKISLDMIWLDQNWKVVDVRSHVPICERPDDFCPRYTPNHEALAVLELRAGQADALKIHRGSTLKVTFPTQYLPFATTP